MARQGKPKLATFEKMAKAKRGNVSKIALGFEVARQTVINWTKLDPKFKAIVDEQRMRLFDDCLVSAEALAIGIPKIEEDETGAKKHVGWIERPDPFMVKYLLSKLGKEEGFGDEIDITSKGEQIKGESTFLGIIMKSSQNNEEEQQEK